MKIVLCIILGLFITFFISSCNTGYQKENGQWVWKTHDEHFGRRSHWIDGIDNQSFKVIKENTNFAVDKHSAYFKGKKIKNASPLGFTTLTKTEYGYAKDHNYVFLDREVILMADPETFVVLEFPYSKDKNDVYCGTIPMKLNRNEVEEFRVINDDKLMKGMKSTTLLSEFLKFNPEYRWIEDLDIEVEWVITGDWGTGETSTKKYQGFEEVNL